MKVREMLQGTIDFHIHAGPDAFTRIADSYELAWMAQRFGMKGIVLKTQHFMGGPAAIMIERLFPGLHVIGGLCLEKAVGGLNPRAVEVAIECGCKIIWMPFLDSAANHDQYLQSPEGMPANTYNIVKELATVRSDQRGEKLRIAENGRLLPEVEEILTLVAKGNVVICSGHMSAADRKLFVAGAKKAGCRKIVLTHVNSRWGQTFCSLDELAAWRKEGGVYFEFVYVALLPYMDNQDPEELVRMIRAAGPENCVLGTDGGVSRAAKGIAFPHPTEEMAAFIGLLQNHGFSPEEIRIMTHDNAARLLDIM